MAIGGNGCEKCRDHGAVKEALITLFNKVKGICARCDKIDDKLDRVTNKLENWNRDLEDKLEAEIKDLHKDTECRVPNKMFQWIISSIVAAVIAVAGWGIVAQSAMNTRLDVALAKIGDSMAEVREDLSEVKIEVRGLSVEQKNIKNQLTRIENGD